LGGRGKGFCARRRKRGKDELILVQHGKRKGGFFCLFLLYEALTCLDPSLLMPRGRGAEISTRLERERFQVGGEKS